MHSPKFRRRPGWLIPALLLIGSGGCGLTDYEARLEVQEKQLRYMEEENKNLSDRPVGLSDRMTEAHPVFLGDHILIKDDATLRSFRIEPDGGKP